MQSRVYEINSELEILESREIAEKVVDAVGAEKILFQTNKDLIGGEPSTLQASNVMNVTGYKIPSNSSSSLQMLKLGSTEQLEKRDRAILTVMNNLSISVKVGSNIISLAYEAKSPQLAHDVISRLIDVYLAKRIEVQGTSGSFDFYTVQSEEVRKQLKAIEDSLRGLKNAAGITTLEDSKTILMTEISNLKQGKEAADADIASSTSIIKELQKSLDNLSKTVVVDSNEVENSIYVELKRNLNDLKLQEKELLSKFKDNNSKVKEIRGMIEETEAALKNEIPISTSIRLGVNTVYQQIQTQLIAETAKRRSLQAKAITIAQQLEDKGRELIILNDNEININKLLRQQSIHERNLGEYIKNLEQSRMDQAMEEGKISNVSLFQPASYPMQKSGPKKKQNILFGFFFAFFGSIGLAFSLEYIDNTIKTPEDVKEKLNLDTLVVIADCPQKKIT